MTVGNRVYSGKGAREEAGEALNAVVMSWRDDQTLRVAGSVQRLRNPEPGQSIARTASLTCSSAAKRPIRPISIPITLSARYRASSSPAQPRSQGRGRTARDRAAGESPGRLQGAAGPTLRARSPAERAARQAGAAKCRARSRQARGASGGRANRGRRGISSGLCGSDGNQTGDPCPNPEQAVWPGRGTILTERRSGKDRPMPSKQFL